MGSKNYVWSGIYLLPCSVLPILSSAEFSKLLKADLHYTDMPCAQFPNNYDQDYSESDQ